MAPLASTILRMTPPRFQLWEKVASTGLSGVWHAFDPQLDVEIALKRPHSPHSRAPEPERAPSPGLGEQALDREIRALRNLIHPHVVTLLDHGRDEDGRFLCLNWIDGESLEVRLARQPLTEAQTQALMRSLLSALSAVHSAGYAHGDIKAGNVIVDAKGHATLIDFGNATPLGTQAPDQVGSIHGMAPELFDGAPRSVASDLYATGVLAYQCLTGQFPFEGETKPQVIAAHVRHWRIPIARRCAISETFAEWIESLIATNPAQRPPSAEAARHALDAGA